MTTQKSPATKTNSPSRRATLRPLKGVRVLSLALNMPGPAALMRCKAMGASCVKLEPPAPRGAPAGVSGDPMSQYNPQAYADLHKGMRIIAADLKTEAGQKALHRELAKADILITSFRPSAIEKLGLGWKPLHKRYPTLSQIAIVGSPGDRAEEPGHDLTYLAENDLITGLDLPATLYADMAGSLMASEAVLQATLNQYVTGKGVLLEVALSDAAEYLALPRHWGLTKSTGPVGGAHAGYGVYACKDGRVAVAALEPHFAARLCEAAGMGLLGSNAKTLIGDFFRSQTRRQLDSLAASKDLPLHTMDRWTASDYW